MALLNLILGIVLIILSGLGWIFKPFTYWWIASIIAALIGIVLIWTAFRSSSIVGEH